MKIRITTELVNSIVSELVDKEGYIDARHFLEKIQRIVTEHETVREMIVGKPTLKPNPTCRINNKQEILGAINRYLRKVKSKTQKSSLQLLLEECYKNEKIENYCLIDANYKIWRDRGRTDYSNQIPVSIENENNLKYMVKDENIVCTGKELCKILGITKPTLIKWERNNIVTKECKRLFIRRNEELNEYKRCKGLLKYFNLDAIKTAIEQCKSTT